MKTIVIADDITGANDIGIMYAKAGLQTYVYNLECLKEEEYPACDTLIVNTDSRFDRPDIAYRKVQRALELVKRFGADQYVDKQCSVFRGNIGAEFDAMMDCLGINFAVVVLGFPENGRTTRHSIHYVWGTELSRSQFRNDPVHPMMESDLTKILKAQTKRKVGAIWYETYDQGKETLEKTLRQAAQEFQYVIMDVRNDQDLVLLAEVLKDQKMICGSSALSEFLARAESSQLQGGNAVRSVGNGKIWTVAGSLQPQTSAQLEHMKGKGYTTLKMDVENLLDRDTRQKEVEKQIRLANEAYQRGETYVQLYSENKPDAVRKGKMMAEKRGISNTGISTLVSESLAQISRDVIRANTISNFIVCGGDTSAAICRALGVKGMKVLEEIEAGIPVCESSGENLYRMVLKSGSFGSPEFLEEAVGVLQRGELK